ncbi:hypothetical protein Purlil1_907 [Purpureocillium lilacinum]|uniref:Uncharacterized protein n=1 Tax=Purpureocillium lilacinum TaxID=33203 RepID=A0ABR0CDV6_PURLI|nr:hypothetical protein Purlil1_907 [Purpureocillium lilacinum]
MATNRAVSAAVMDRHSHNPDKVMLRRRPLSWRHKSAAHPRVKATIGAGRVTGSRPAPGWTRSRSRSTATDVQLGPAAERPATFYTGLQRLRHRISQPRANRDPLFTLLCTLPEPLIQKPGPRAHPGDPPPGRRCQMEHGRSLRRGLGGGAARIELPSGSGAVGELPCLLVRPVRRCRAEKVGIRTLVLDRLRRAQTRCTAPPALLALRSSELSTSSMTGSRCFPNACTVVNGRNNHTERGSSTLSTQRLDADSVLLATQGQDKTLILGHLGARSTRARVVGGVVGVPRHLTVIPRGYE